MHIPAMDSLRQERMGIITSEDNEIIMLVQDYIQTRDTDEMDTHDPIESFSRPFPYLATTSGLTVYPETFIQNNPLKSISENVIEYTSYLYESMKNGEWVDELEHYNDGDFNAVELELTSGLLAYVTTNHPPQTLYRMMYESAHKYMDKKYDNESTLFNNPLTDIDGRERYEFEYLPAIDEVDSWDLKHYHTDTVTEEDIHIHAESLWLRYTIGDTTEERPLIIMKNSESACMALSPNVEYGEMEDNEAPIELVTEIINENTQYDSALIKSDISELKNTRTMTYLENYLSQ